MAHDHEASILDRERKRYAFKRKGENMPELKSMIKMLLLLCLIIKQWSRK